MKSNKYIFSISAFVFFYLLCFVVSVKAQNGNFYKLVCRKGDNQVYVKTFEDNSVELKLRFQKAGVPAILRDAENRFSNYNDLQPGECTWEDRTIRSDEPSEIQILLENYTLFVTTASGSSGSLLFSNIPERPGSLSKAQLFLSRIVSYDLLGQRPSERRR